MSDSGHGSRRGSDTPARSARRRRSEPATQHTEADVEHAQGELTSPRDTKEHSGRRRSGARSRASGDQDRSAGTSGARSRRGASSGSPRRTAKTSGARASSPDNSAAGATQRSTAGERRNQILASLIDQSRRRRGGVVLGGLIASCGLVLVALLGMLGMQLFGPGIASNQAEAPIVDPPEGHSRLQPDVFNAAPQTDMFDSVAERGEEAPELTQDALFPEDESISAAGVELEMVESETADVCTATVWGEQLAETVSEGQCSEAARGVYQDDGQGYLAQFTLFDLATADSAEAVSQELDPESQDPGFVLPLNTDHAGLQEGYSQATTQVIGHYLAVYWVARTDGELPEDDDSLASLNVAVTEAAVPVFEWVNAASSEDD